VNWVESNGGTVDGAAVHSWFGADGGSGFGLQAAKTCPEGTTLITLPSKLHLTYGNDTTDPRLLSLISKVPAELWGAKLALQLLAHRIHAGADSSDDKNSSNSTSKLDNFAPYIAALPLGFPGIPMFFPPDAIAALEYPPVTEQVKRRCRWLLRFANEVLAPIRGNPAEDPFDGVAIDANALGWALAAVTSRAFRTRGADQPAAMLPLIDMANHSFDPNAKIVGQSGTAGALQMVAIKEIQQGDPILLSYGNLVNDFLLLDYGFIVPDNPYDTVQLRFDRNLIEAAKAVVNVGSTTSINDSNDEDNSEQAGSDQLSALPAWQNSILENLGLAGPGANTEVSIIQLTRTKVRAPVDARLLAGVRILCAANARELENAAAKSSGGGGNGTGGRLESINASIEAFGAWERPLSLRNEVSTLKTLSGVALIALSQFSSTEEDDIKLLKNSSSLSADMQLAVRFRLEKKRLLSAALEALAARLKTVTEEAAAVAVAAGGTGGSGGKKNKKESTKASSSKGFGR
jgi:histone-lysine N-methyltransferase SETD3